MRGVVCLLVACSRSSAAPEPAPAPCPVDKPSLGTGLAVERWPLLDACIDVVRATGYHLRVLGGAAKPAPAWRSDNHLVAVTNAGMFHDNGAPVGLIVDRGTARGADNKKMCGYLAWDPVAASDPPAIVAGRDCPGFDLAALRARYRSLVQSYRLLGCDGKPLPWSDIKRYSAAAIGVDRAGAITFMHARAPSTMTELRRRDRRPRPRRRAVPRGRPRGLARRARRRRRAVAARQLRDRLRRERRQPRVLDAAERDRPRSAIAAHVTSRRMSFSFYVALDAAPSFAAVRRLADGIACDDLPANSSEDDALRDGYACHVYVPHRSARGLEIVYERGALQIRIMTCSTRSEHELALTLARGFGSDITPEDRDEALSPAALASEYGATWIDHMVAAGPSSVFAMADRELEMSGARRPFYVGPRLAAELGKDPAALMARFLRVQYVDLDEDVYAATVMRVTPKGDDKPFRVTAWAEGVRYLFPAVDKLAVLDDSGAITVDYERGPALAGAAWQWLDEKHALVDKLEGAAWAALVARARG